VTFDLRALLDPRSIAIVGASADFGRINGRPLKFMLQYGYGGTLFPVNPRYTEIAGVPCFPSVAELPETPELALIGLSAQAAARALEECGRRGVRAAVVFGGGYGEAGQEGQQLQDELVAIADRHGISLCGPNCLGFVNFPTAAVCSFTATFDSVDLLPGPVAFVSQSGALGAYVYALARERGVGFSYYISSGNEAQLDFADYVEYLVDDPSTKLILGYLEAARDGPALLRAADRAAQAGDLRRGPKRRAHTPARWPEAIGSTTPRFASTASFASTPSRRWSTWRTSRPSVASRTAPVWRSRRCQAGPV
jgi:acetate---CoA ligase (ADP-forming)